MKNQCPDITIVIPTLEEEENIPVLFSRIFSVVETAGFSAQVILVDDSSRDRTVAEAKKYPVDVIVRRDQKGLASACVEGFKRARAEIIVVMDADLQHPPEKIPELVAGIRRGSDIVIASRHARNGSYGSIGRTREFVSRCAASLSYQFFPRLRAIQDKESGFFAFKRKIIDGVCLRPCGYKILLEILVRGQYEKVEEIGYLFENRVMGKSKFTFATIFSYMRHIKALLFGREKA